MMSYLWILLLGSLLTSSAKAQDEGGLGEEVGTGSETQSPQLHPTPEANGEPETDEETNQSVAEQPTALSETEHNTDPDLDAKAADNEEPPTPARNEEEEVTPAADNEEPPTPAGDEEGEVVVVVTPADDNEEPTTPAGDEEGEVVVVVTPAADEEEEEEEEEEVVVTPADDNEEPTTPAGDDAGIVTPAGDVAGIVTSADDKEEPTTPAGDGAGLVPSTDDNDRLATTTAVDVDAENTAEEDVEQSTLTGDKEAATTQVPVADPEVDDPEAEQTTANVEEEKPTSEPEDKVKSKLNPAENEEEQSDSELIVPSNREKPKATHPSDEIFNLEEALPESNSNPAGEGRRFGSGAHAAGAKGDVEKPEARGSSSSLAGIVSAIAVAAVGAVTGYFTYQKKKLCFKDRQEADPEAARKADAAEAQSDPQVLSNLLNSS